MEKKPRIVEYLEKNNITLAAFSEKVGYHRMHLTYIFKKKKPGSPRVIRSIIEATNGYVSEDDFIVSKFGK